MVKNIGYLVALIAVAVLSYFLGMSNHKLEGNSDDSRPKTTLSKETRLSGEYKFVNPLIECDSYAASDMLKDKQLRSKLSEYAKQVIHDGRAESISIYYRDLNNGPWIGINEDELFTPASLLKLPILIAALKYSEKESGFLQKLVVFGADSKDEFNPNIKDEMIVLGKSYSLLELLERMIVNSDNDAKNLIMKELASVGFIPILWKDLGMEDPMDSRAENFLTVKDYSAFFRILYNSTYLSHANSNLALEFLSRSNFKDGIRAGVPDGIVVSSKFGERGLIDSDAKQLHDCGIVYRAGSPYLLCVMTKGHDWSAQKSVIKEVSETVYSGY
jgi:beta-lactamase class A